MATWRSNLEAVHILAILRGFSLVSSHCHLEALFCFKFSRRPLSGGIKTTRRNVPFYVQTPRKSLLIFVVPKRRK